MNVAMRWRGARGRGNGKAARKPLKRLMVTPWSPVTPLKQGVNESEALALDRNEFRAPAGRERESRLAVAGNARGMHFQKTRGRGTAEPAGRNAGATPKKP